MCSVRLEADGQLRAWGPLTAILGPAGLPLAPTLRNLRLLLWRQQRKDLRPQFRLHDRNISLRNRPRLSGCADRLLVDRSRIHGILKRLVRGPHPLERRTILLAHLRCQRLDLLLLRIRQINATQRKTSVTPRELSARSAPATATVASAVLRECSSSRRQHAAQHTHD